VIFCVFVSVLMILWKIQAIILLNRLEKCLEKEARLEMNRKIIDLIDGIKFADKEDILFVGLMFFISEI